MAQRGRIVIPGQPLHVIQRGNNRLPCFLTIEDYQRYKTVLQDASVRARCGIHAYVLMSNHVHLLVTPADKSGPSRMMQLIGRRYVRYFNDRYGRTGTLWEGRYRSTIIESERYLLACSRYIELNPIRAGMVDHPGSYPWSSFRHNANGEPDALVTPHPLYTGLGARNSERQAAYLTLFAGPLGLKMVDSIRRATQSGRILGPGPMERSLTSLVGGDRIVSPLPSDGAWLED